MNTDLSIPTLIAETKHLLGGVRQSLVKVMQNLHIIRESGEWREEASSWSEFCEDSLGISQSMASKLLTAHSAWVLRAGVAPEKLEGIDYEKLYLAAPLLTGNNTEEVLAQAKTLTRSELKQTNNEKAPHEGTFEELCTTCYVSRANHN